MMASESEEPVADWCERYRPQTESELEGNDAARIAGFQIGFATYF